jgi:hypothetical protein
LSNPQPIKRARRIEMRRKFLGADRCFCCKESNTWCLEIDHPVGRDRDVRFTRTVCRNNHRTLEFNRDLHGLTKNGQHKTHQSLRESHVYYLQLLALDQESIADALESPHVSIPLVRAALRSCCMCRGNCGLDRAFDVRDKERFVE